MKDKDFLFNLIISKLDKLEEKFDKIAESQIRTEKDLNYHIVRTDELQDQKELLEQKVALLREGFEEQKKYIKLMGSPFIFVRWLLQQLKILR